MQNFVKLEDFPYSCNNNNTIDHETAHLKINKKWQSYRIGVIVLLPCTLIKIIYHLAAGIFGAIGQKDELALDSLKWMWSSWYQDLREILGHLYLVVPFCNDAGFTMVASALTYKNYYNTNFRKNMDTVRDRPLLAANFIDDQCVKADRAFDQLNDAHNDMIEQINKGIVERQNRNDNSLENYEKSFKKNTKWVKDYWKNKNFQEKFGIIADKWGEITLKIKGDHKNGKMAALNWQSYFDECAQPLIELKGDFEKSVSELLHHNQATLRHLIGDSDDYDIRNENGTKYFKNFETTNIHNIKTILENIYGLNLNGLVTFIKNF